MDIIKRLSQELNIKEWQVKNTIELIDAGNTIPFIARYRKEVTGNLDDTTLRNFYERLTYLRNLLSKKEEVKRLIDEQGKLTDEIIEKIEAAETITEVDDIYRPFRPKKRTRATIAKEKGLEPLANLIISQDFEGDLEKEAEKFINEELKVLTREDAILGALDIIAEDISDNADYRKAIRDITYKEGIIVTKKTKDERSPYEMYYDYSEAVSRIVPHRILAINRGEREEFLSVKIEAPVDKILLYLEKRILKREGQETKYIKDAIKDSYNRLIAPSIEREIRNMLTEKAEEQAIKVFALNLKNLLLQPPVKNKVVLGFDPAFRTGCKIAVVDETGKLLDTATVYPTEPQNDIEGSKRVLKELIYKHNVDIISLGNGTASRESEAFLSELIKEVKEETGKELFYVVVSEAGASVYSASELAAKEFPDINVSLRGAISIARRLQDPLAELVKIDPKSIGVGQYQHDVSQKRLSEALNGVVEDAVNSVGVDLNTASQSLLSYVSGINSAIAKNIVEYREQNGKFKNRRELLKVKRLGEKAFEQCAGFLRITDGDNVFDNTAVHPESYEAAEKLINILGYSKEDVKQNRLQDIDERLKNYGEEKIAKEINIGIPTLQDIVKELKKPGRDIRDELEKPIFRSDVLKMEDLKPGMVLKGTVRNVADFGAFVDIGVHQDGLVHKSEISDSYVKHPADFVKVGQIVDVKVLDVDLERKRIALTMKI
ncbi:Tex family protein [Thermobrachium celere]|uniref:Transcription accessory protein (S1 RNA-binding domain) n=1 Tax=Thermobrachium celere DSM 8682 TaxID=941824 RepID=R7RQH6_9CLOT|nr:Tex family protein [Thermobrachium celere]CDF57500.1 Transcription accessory protein (S1 RNA-binding domain) [Thermobrachium celere DSM 8682]